MAGSRPSAAIRSGSLNPAPWWETKEFANLKKLRAARLAGTDPASLEAGYLQVYETAVRLRQIQAQSTILTSIGNLRLQRFHFREALDAYLQSKRLAESMHDWETAGMAAINLAGLYEQLWDLPSAENAAEQSHLFASRAGSTHYEAELLIGLARLSSLHPGSSAEPLFQQGIEQARAQADLALEAKGWDWLGEFLLARGDIPGAERALEEAFRIRALHARKDLRLSHGRLGALRLAQAKNSQADERQDHLHIAERFTRNALDAAQKLGGGRSAYILQHQLGGILSEAGRADEALTHYQIAVELAALWKSGAALPSADSLIASNVELDHRIFDSFVEASAHRALEHRNKEDAARWTAASIAASEAIRAASLRETQSLAPIWREKLPPAYWEKLGRFRAESARLMRAGEPSSSLASRLKSEISELEASAGLRFFSGIPENFPNQSSLIHFQESLSSSEILLSFHLGSQESLLWAITRSGAHLYRLEPERVIQPLAESFRDEVLHAGDGDRRFGPPNANVRASRELYEKLFGQLSRDESEKHSWLLSVEGALFELPFSALVTGGVQSNVTYLIENHSVQVVPSAFSLPRTARTPVYKNVDKAVDKEGSRLVAVGDPVYNEADPRWRPERSALWTHQIGTLFAGFAASNKNSVQLNRLPESGREIAAVAAGWTSVGSTILEGNAATRAAFLDALRRPASTIHLATHVLSPEKRSQQAFVAFSIGSEGQPELLATSDVARLAVPGASVFMTGCSSGTGEAADGAGLLGLTRAWMVAGASEVIATLWQVPDRSGDLVPAFYRHRKSEPAAEALRLSQVEMLHSGSWQSSPAYWASYQVTGGAQ